MLHYFQLFFSAKGLGRFQRFAGSSGKKTSLSTKRLGFFSLPPRLGGLRERMFLSKAFSLVPRARGYPPAR
jgi:hypothetical protein